MAIDIPVKGRRTASWRVANALREKILNGEYLPGALLPGRRALSKEYEVAHVTIEQSIKALISEGLLRAENGRGTFVADRVEKVSEQHLHLAGGPVNIARASAMNAGPGSTVPRSATTAVVGIVAYMNEIVEKSPHSTYVNRTILDSCEATISLLGGTSRFVNICGDDDGPKKPEQVADLIGSANLDAVVVLWMDNDLSTDECLSNISVQQKNAVLVGGKPDLRLSANVYYDSVDAGYKAACHLAERGCRRIVYFAPYTVYWSNDRTHGMRQAAVHRRAPFELIEFVNPRTVAGLVIDQHLDFGIAHAKALLESGVQFDGIVAANDWAAYSLMNVFRAKGLQAGADYLLMGFDDQLPSRKLGLSTMRPPVEQMGTEAARMAFHLLSGGSPARICLQSHVVVRSSTCSRSTRKTEE